LKIKPAKQEKHMNLKLNKAMFGKIFSRKILLPLLLIIVVGAAIAGGIFFVNKDKNNFLSAEEASNRVIEYVNNSIASQGGTEKASFTAIVEEGGVYKMDFKVGEEAYTMYVSKDGKYLFPQALDISTSTQENTEKNSETVKSDRPDLKIFVMSYCPFGLMAEKMYLPVYNLLKDKADMGIYFVYYAMHDKKEVDENLRQYCIQKEEKEKYYDYLSCFVKDGKYEPCLTSAKIDAAKLKSCETQTDNEYKITANYNDKTTWLSGKYPLFNVNADLNELYGVQGSPTFVVNGTSVSVSPSSPEKLKQVVCEAFNSAPQECSQVLSEDPASTGFGMATGTATTDTTAGCSE
jgi:hypothetical protein